MEIYIKIGRNNIFVFLNKHLILKQPFLKLKNGCLYTYFFILHLLIKLGLFKF